MLSDVDHKAVASALIRGQDCANQVKNMTENGSVPPQTLVNKVVDYIALALSLMVPTCPPPPPPHPESSSSSRNMAGPLVPRRSLKKRKLSGNERYRDDPSPLINDGFSWRKYGSKIIKTSPHKRNYFRCTYSKDRNCKAKKRVQRIQDDPLVYRTTYEGNHMCEAPVVPHSSNDGTTDGSMMIRFDQLDQSISDLVLPQSVPNDQQITTGDEATNQIMSLAFDIDEFLVDDDQIRASQLPPLSPENFISLDDLSAFNYDPFKI